MNTSESAAPASPVRYGSFTTRMIASTIDLGMIFMVILPIIDILMGQLFSAVDSDALMAVLTDPNVRFGNPEFWPKLLKVLHEQRVFERMFAENFLQVVFIALYTLPFWFRYSATPGKMLFRLQIQDRKTGKPMSESQAIVRFFGYIISILPLSLGFLWISLNKKCLGFHDIIAGTMVVMKPRVPKDTSSAHQSEGP